VPFSVSLGGERAALGPCRASAGNLIIVSYEKRRKGGTTTSTILSMQDREIGSLSGWKTSQGTPDREKKEKVGGWPQGGREISRPDRRVRLFLHRGAH